MLDEPMSAVRNRENQRRYNKAAYDGACEALVAAVVALWLAGAEPLDIREHVERALATARVAAAA
jgi:hypothetical protein